MYTVPHNRFWRISSLLHWRYIYVYIYVYVYVYCSPQPRMAHIQFTTWEVYICVYICICICILFSTTSYSAYPVYYIGGIYMCIYVYIYIYTVPHNRFWRTSSVYCRYMYVFIGTHICILFSTTAYGDVQFTTLEVYTCIYVYIYVHCSSQPRMAHIHFTILQAYICTHTCVYMYTVPRNRVWRISTLLLFSYIYMYTYMHTVLPTTAYGAYPLYYIGVLFLFLKILFFLNPKLSSFFLQHVICRHWRFTLSFKRREFSISVQILRQGWRRFCIRCIRCIRSNDIQPENLDKTTETELICYPPLGLNVVGANAANAANAASQWNLDFKELHQISLYETKQWFGTNLNVIYTRETCGQCSRMAAEC